MCFSAQASFAAGAALLPAGAYCVTTAVRKNLRYLPLALVPVAFGVQQCAEGFVWVGYHADDFDLVHRASVFFLFFAVAFWPFWIPFSLLLPEPRVRVRWLLGGLTVLSLVWLWFYYPVAAHPQWYLSVKPVQHSLQYDISAVPADRYLPRDVWRTWYVLAIAVPLAFGRFDPSKGAWGNLLGGALVAVLFCVSYVVYWYAFLSVWCFFAALLSLLLCIAFYRLPARPARKQRPQVAPEEQALFG